MKKVRNFAAVLFMVASITACQDDNVVIPTDPDGLKPVDSLTFVNSDFKTNTEYWTADFSDYDEQQAASMEFKFNHGKLPSPLDSTKKAIMMNGHNRSDDMFMFVKRKVIGLKPNSTYRLVFDVEIASQYPENGIGIGGSPGGSVYLKAGASGTEPKKVKEGTFYKFNLDKGNQAEGGKDLVVLGTVGIAGDAYKYELITRSNASQPLAVTSNAKGELWLVVGTDSGFEGQTTLYYNRIKVSVKPQS